MRLTRKKDQIQVIALEMFDRMGMRWHELYKNDYKAWVKILVWAATIKHRDMVEAR